MKPNHFTVILGIIFFSLYVHGTGLDKALQLYQRGNFSEAITAFNSLLKSGKNNTQQLKIIWLHLGILKASMGQNREAEVWFKKVLSLDPMLQPPPDVSPKIIRAFEKVRTSVGSNPFKVNVEAIPKYSEKVPFLRIEIQSDPGNIVKNIKLITNDNTIIDQKIENNYIEFRISREELNNYVKDNMFKYRLALCDEYGNIVWEKNFTTLVEETKKVEPVTKGEIEQASKGQKTPIYKKWWFWTIIGGTIVAAGGITAGVLLTTQSSTEYEINTIEIE